MPKLITASYKQRKFVNSYLKHGSVKDAAKDAYSVSNDTSAYRLGRNTLKQPMVQAYMKRVLDKAGLSDEVVANGLKAIYEASLRESSLKQAKPADGLKAIQEIAKLKDLYPAEKKKIEKHTVSIKLEGKSTAELQEILKKQELEMRRFRKLLGSEEIKDAKVLP